jgi:steroid delta-isomerase-like uncharacterized protein
MNDSDANKQVVQNFLQAVWRERNLNRLAEFWTEDCINHAHAPVENRGLEAARAYHEPIIDMLNAAVELNLAVVHQVAEGDMVATHLVNTVRHVGPFLSWPASGDSYAMPSMRFDRIRDGKIAEHWTLADIAGLAAYFTRPR